jgi:hypothetical protein
MDEISQRQIALPAWHCDLTVLMTPEGPFYIIRQLCDVLGVKDVQEQVERMKENAVLHEMIRLLLVQTATRGKQKTWCINQDAIGFWWGGIQIERLRPEVRSGVLKLQKAIMKAASRLLFGEIPDVLPPAIMVYDEDLADIRQYTRALEDRIGALESVVFADESEDESDENS